MKVIQLKYFAGVVEAGSFLAASRTLNIAQPALSRQISELETELGVKLLNRNASGTEPTEVGREFYSRAYSILQEIDAARAFVQQSGSTLSGEVRAAIMMSAASLIGPKLVNEMATRYPNIRVMIVDGLRHQTGDLIESGQVDIGVIPNAHTLVRAKYTPILKEYLYLFTKRHGSERRLGEISVGEAFAQDLILPTNNVDLRRHIELLALRMNVPLKARFEQQSTLTISGLMLAGLGSTISGWPAFHSYWKDGKVDAYRITDAFPERIISLVVPTNRPGSRISEVTIQVLKELIRSENASGSWQGELLTAE